MVLILCLLIHILSLFFFKQILPVPQNVMKKKVMKKMNKSKRNGSKIF